jgi:selenide,water dikinase
LDKLPKMHDKNLLVGIETSDDAAVYKLNDDMAVIQTLDFFTPVVDDPYTFGQIAAANSLSDIYAMGGKPTVAMNIVCFPNCLPIEVLGDILKGGADKVIEAGAVVAGGHSVQDEEPKYGLSVMGMVHPDKILKNYGSNPGDVLIITKPLGTGIINTAIKGGIASQNAYSNAVKVMTTLNRYAGEIAAKHNITACTDITGFGLMGHAYEMAKASNVTMKLRMDEVPYIKEARGYAQMGLVPEGSYNNRHYLEGQYQFENLETWQEDILFDPQTSGGLLITCTREDSYAILEELNKLEIKSALVGEVVEFSGKYIIVI